MMMLGLKRHTIRLCRTRGFASTTLNNDLNILKRWTGISTKTLMMEEGHWKRMEFEHDDKTGIVKLVLNRPEKMNALDLQAFHEIDSAFQKIREGKDLVKCVILEARGDHFSAGIDLTSLMAIRKGMSEFECPGRANSFLADVIQKLQDITSLPETCHVPVLAVSQGACLGAGLDLISACDIRFGTATSQFSIKEVDVAIVADLGSLQRLPHIIGEQKTRYLAYTGDTIDGVKAKEFGLLLECSPDKASAMDEANKMAHIIAKKSPITMKGIKQSLNYSRDHSISEGLDQVKLWNASHLNSKDLELTIQKIIEKVKKL